MATKNTFILLLSVLASTSSGLDIRCYYGHHMVLSDPMGRRSPETVISDAKFGMCDNSLIPGWYRIDSPAGDLMPTTFVKAGGCSSTHPIWLNGTLPDEKDGNVTRPICVTEIKSNCGSSFNIHILNCSTFMLYELKSTNVCDSLYCFGERARCPPGFTGFQGNCQTTTTTTTTTTTKTTTPPPFNPGQGDSASGTHGSLNPQGGTGNKDKVQTLPEGVLAAMVTTSVFAMMSGLASLCVIVLLHRNHRCGSITDLKGSSENNTKSMELQKNKHPLTHN